jgi:glyoxylase-like metal-dependent hydrolase (beta-lactamase superfamily II)
VLAGDEQLSGFQSFQHGGQNTDVTGPGVERLYFRQLLSGRDFAIGDPLASQMVNFAYAIGDRATGECLLIDPAYAVDDLLAAVEADGMTVVGVLATHYHADHIGGSMMGYTIEGVTRLLERVTCPVHVQSAEAPWVTRNAGLAEADLVGHQSGDIITVGAVTVELVHTPGHTPGSQCFLVDGRLVTGDTLFLDGCGRTDLPGSDPEAMYDSLHRLAALPDGTVIFPGHHYSLPSSGTLGAVREQNYVFKPSSKQQWLTMFGR